MTQEQCESISKQFESVALPKSGIVRTTDKDLVRAPETIGGYGIKDLYTKQFASHIQSLIDHGTSQSVTGQLIRGLGEGVLLEAGMETDLFNIKPSVCSWLEHNWITNTLQMMEDFDVVLTHDIKPLQKWKIDDTFIMQEISGGTFTPQEMQQINQVRQYLQVTTLADISSYDGKKLTKDTLMGNKQTSCSSKKYNWPRIPKPPRSYLKLWKKAIIHHFTCSRMIIKDEFQCDIWTNNARELHSWWYSVEDT